MNKPPDSTIQMILDIVEVFNKAKKFNLFKSKRFIKSFPKWGCEEFVLTENVIYISANVEDYSLRNGIWLGCWFTPDQVKIARDVWLNL